MMNCDAAGQPLFGNMMGTKYWKGMGEMPFFSQLDLTHFIDYPN